MTTNVKSVGPETPLRDAAALMRDEGIGMLPVLALGRIPVGVLTDRDIAVRAFANNLPQSAPVRDAMTKATHTILQDSELDDALALMELEKVGRVMVCDDEGHLAGIFSLGDAVMKCNGDGRITRVSQRLAERNHLPHPNPRASLL